MQTHSSHSHLTAAEAQDLRDESITFRNMARNQGSLGAPWADSYQSRIHALDKIIRAAKLRESEDKGKAASTVVGGVLDLLRKRGQIR